MNINCVNQFANAEELRILFKFENADTFSQFFHNTTEPCNFNRTIEKLKRKNEEKEGAAGTQGQPGNQGGIGGGNGTQISAAKPAARRRPVQLVFVPIPEPTGNVQQSPISIAPPSGVVAPVQQPVASAGPVPSNTLQSNAGSPGISSTSSKATPTAQTGMQKERKKQTDRQTDRERQRETERDRERQRETDRQTGRQTDRQTDRETETDRDRQRQRKTERQRQTFNIHI